MVNRNLNPYLKNVQVPTYHMQGCGSALKYNADPDTSFHYNADPDPTFTYKRFHFFGLHASIVRPRPSMAPLGASKAPNFHFNADPDPAS